MARVGTGEDAALPVIACLHTADSNAAVFDAALAGAGVPGARLRHLVRPGLLRAAEAAGGPTPDILRAAADEMEGLAPGADVVLLTCSTLGPAAGLVRARVPVLRVDAALASAAVRHGGFVVVLCATTTTLEPTRALFGAAARHTGAQVAVRLVPGAWAAFLAGDHDGYWGLVARAADAAAVDGRAEGRAAGEGASENRGVAGGGGPGADGSGLDAAGPVGAGAGGAAPGGITVVLAQASMAGAAALARCRPLTSPAAGLQAALQAAQTVRG